MQTGVRVGRQALLVDVRPIQIVLCYAAVLHDEMRWNPYTFMVLQDT